MKRLFTLLAVMALMLILSVPAWATNGSNLIGVGPTSRAMGGVGVAAPQDAIAAIFANPAAMFFGPDAAGSEATFSGTFFNPTVKSSIRYGTTTNTAESQMNPSAVPAIGIRTPLSDRFQFGIGAYGVSGMGVDYKEQGPLYQNLYTKLEVMKFAPNVAYLATPNLSIGAGVSVDYQNLDLGSGGSHGYAYGLQIGALYRIGIFNLGASYTTPQSVDHENVVDFDGDGNYDNLELENPAIYALGIAANLTKKLLVEFNYKFIPWSEAAGYGDFDWNNQSVYAIGAQYRIADKFTLRAGYNYAENPVNAHPGFNLAGTTNVQGISVPNSSYESFRILGFPAVVEQHLTLGFGWEMTDKLLLNLSYMRAFEQEISQADSSDTLALSSSLEENTFSLGLTFRF